MDKLKRAQIFRDRLTTKLAAVGMTQSALARACDVDRSTIAQILGDTDSRLPNAHVAAACASALGVSADWLLGLSERSETAADLLSATFHVTEAEHTPTDDQIIAWHRETAGYKIRHVPATVPDILKTPAVMEFEYGAFHGRTPQQEGFARRGKIDWLRDPGSDYEICAPLDVVESLARGEGYWRGLAPAARAEQIEHMARFCRDLYPSLRLYLYDPKEVFSAPVTVFGPLLAVLYVGRYYMVFREARQVRAMTEHFDHLVRHARVDARNVGDTLAGMLEAA